MSLRLILASVCLLSAACSGQPPTSPSPGQPPASSAPEQPPVSNAAGPGSYVLGFYRSAAGGMEAVSTLPFGQELVLGGHVKDSAGGAAQSGSVVFEYCSLKGIPTDDITRPDETPIESCANGSAAWVPLLTLSVNRSGDAYMNFGFVRVTPAIGFRVRYLGQGSNIADGTSAPRNMTFHP